MKVHERIKHLRKDILKMTQDEFGEKMGVSRDVVNNLERGRVNIGSDRIKLICSVFSINEEWLRSGTPPMKPTDKLSTYLGQIDSGNDEFIKDLIVAYMELDPSSKKALQVLTEKMYQERKERGR